MTFQCSISTIVDEFNNVSIKWEHNGTSISNSDLDNIYTIASHGLSTSTLTVNSPDLAETEGTYRCRVDYRYGNFSLVSREAHFEAPSEFEFLV